MIAGTNGRHPGRKKGSHDKTLDVSKLPLGILQPVLKRRPTQEGDRGVSDWLLEKYHTTVALLISSSSLEFLLIQLTKL
jgi:hypothetical protein